MKIKLTFVAHECSNLHGPIKKKLLAILCPFRDIIGRGGKIYFFSETRVHISKEIPLYIPGETANLIRK